MREALPGAGRPQTVAGLPAVGARAAARPDLRVRGLLALGHLVVDMSQGARPTLPGLSDRAARRWALAAFVGLGVAACHPEGHRAANQVTGDRKATGLSVFSTGGNVGIAPGPPVITWLVTTFGLTGTLGTLAPASSGALPRLAPLPPARPRAGARPPARATGWGRWGSSWAS